jgi:uncharacterized protein YbjQ (UPF0145 family)
MVAERWECPCGVSNPAKRSTCQGCGVTIERAEEIRRLGDRAYEVKQYEHVHTSTTGDIPGHRITKGLGVITATVVLGIHALKDILVGMTDVFGGRSGTLEDEFEKAAQTVLRELRGEADKKGGNGVVGVRLDYETLGSMALVMAQGTAVIIEPV